MIIHYIFNHSDKSNSFLLCNYMATQPVNNASHRFSNRCHWPPRKLLLVLAFTDLVDPMTCCDAPCVCVCVYVFMFWVFDLNGPLLCHWCSVLWLCKWEQDRNKQRTSEKIFKDSYYSMCCNKSIWNQNRLDLLNTHFWSYCKLHSK